MRESVNLGNIGNTLSIMALQAVLESITMLHNLLFF